MSKWVNSEKFEEFRTDRENDNSKQENNTFARKWRNPQMGTLQKANEYFLRMLPDTDGNFYKKMFYHMFLSGESWNFIMCPKTHGMDNYCPWCAITQLLYQGSAADKKRAAQYKRKEKFVGNTFVIKDPRDANEQDVEKHYAGKTYLYEFPGVVEGQIKKEITDTENGWGPVIFDPEEGHNMILRIGAKKPDANGKTWPDYTQSTFSKKPSPIADTDAEIEEIMGTVQSISDYLNDSMWAPEKHEEVLKSEMVWEDVEADFLRHFKAADKVKEKATRTESTPDDTPDPDVEAHGGGTETTSNTGLNQSDEDLLNELADL